MGAVQVPNKTCYNKGQFFQITLQFLHEIEASKKCGSNTIHTTVLASFIQHAEQQSFLSSTRALSRFPPRSLQINSHRGKPFIRQRSTHLQVFTFLHVLTRPSSIFNTPPSQISPLPSHRKHRQQADLTKLPLRSFPPSLRHPYILSKPAPTHLLDPSLSVHHQGGWRFQSASSIHERPVQLWW